MNAAACGEMLPQTGFHKTELKFESDQAVNRISAG
jgi:hypothetical protein